MEYGYDYGSSVGEATAVGVVGIFLVFYVILYMALIAFLVVSYILQSKGFYTIAKRRGIDKPWMAWIPYANYWIIGRIADDYCLKVEKKQTNHAKKLLGSAIGFGCTAVLYIICTVIFIVGSGVSVGFNEEAAAPVLSLLFLVFIPSVLLFLAAGVILNVFFYIALYKIFNSCQPSKSVLYLLLSIFVGVVQPFFIFAVRNSDEGMPVDAEEQNVYFHSDD